MTSMTSTTDLAATAELMAHSAKRARQAREAVLGFAGALHEMLTKDKVSGLSLEAHMDLQKRCEGIIDDLDNDNPDAEPELVFAQVDEFVALVGFYTERSES